MTAPLKPLADDTSLAAEAYLHEQYSRLEVSEKIEMVLALNRLGDGMALEGARERYPHSSEREQRLRLFALKHGRDLAVKVFGWDPEVEGW